MPKKKKTTKKTIKKVVKKVPKEPEVPKEEVKKPEMHIPRYYRQHPNRKEKYRINK